jgi:hypothetical protein
MTLKYHHQQHGIFGSGRTNIGEHLLLSSAKVFQSSAVTGRTFFKSPNIGKPPPLVASLKRHPKLQ